MEFNVFEVNHMTNHEQSGAVLSPPIAGSTMGWTRSLLDEDTNLLKSLPPSTYTGPDLGHEC